MSASVLKFTYGITGVQYKSFRKIKGGAIYCAEMLLQKISCPRCSCKNHRFKGKKIRRLKMPPTGHKKCYLDLILHRLKCVHCKHQWWPRLPFMKGKFRMTRSFIQYAFDLLGICTVQDVSRYLGISWNVVKSIHKLKLKVLYKKIPLKEVRYISVDEFAIKKGHEYMSVFSDIESGRVLHAVEGRKMEDILPFLLKLIEEAKNLKAIAMDMSVPYISAVRNSLPGIDIVFDHFHVNALMNKALDDIRKERHESLNQEEEKVLKGNRFLLLRNYENLDVESKGRLEKILQANEPLFKAHALKEQFRLFWRLSSPEEGSDFLDKWIFDALDSGIKRLKRLAETVDAHREGLISYFRHRISNAGAEGLNNKIKTMKRQAYGFRDMEYFKLRLYHLHESRYSFVG